MSNVRRSSTAHRVSSVSLFKTCTLSQCTGTLYSLCLAIISGFRQYVCHLGSGRKVHISGRMNPTWALAASTKICIVLFFGLLYILNELYLFSIFDLWLFTSSNPFFKEKTLDDTLLYEPGLTPSVRYQRLDTPLWVIQTHKDAVASVREAPGFQLTL